MQVNGPRAVQRVMAEIMDRVQGGQPQTISLNGRFPVVLISIDEFDRLRDLSRTVSWFRAAGLDLSSRLAAGRGSRDAIAVEFGS